MNILKHLAFWLWGEFQPGELQKFSLLSLIFSLMIGTYWTLRPIKDSAFATIVGIDYLPYAKILSLCVIVPLVLVYSKLIDIFPRHKVFYALSIVYGLAALAFGYAFMHPEIGLLNAVSDPARVIGWVWYVYVESMGSLLVALFWAFTTDVTLPDSANRGFPMIALFGQMGNIFGPFFLNTKRLGLATSAPIVAICGGLIFCIGFLLRFFMEVVPADQLRGFDGTEEEEEKASEPGFFEGLKLLVTKGYLFGIFLIITIYEVIVTILDYHFKATAKAAFPLEADYSAYLSQYAWMTGVVATLCVLFGINKIQRALGIRFSLFLLPILVAGAVTMLKLNPSTLTIAFWIMVISKAINYALNQPTLKQLYIPTSRDTKYKAQAWIEMFGSRGSKGLASLINSTRKGFVKTLGPVAGVDKFLTMSATFSGAVIVLWFFVVVYVSNIYTKAVKDKKVIC
ncbi:MAG: Npt1/Npt2 family nucleotide transporter [Candidatus Babeliales bacterium]